MSIEKIWEYLSPPSNRYDALEGKDLEREAAFHSPANDIQLDQRKSVYSTWVMDNARALLPAVISSIGLVPIGFSAVVFGQQFSPWLLELRAAEDADFAFLPTWAPLVGEATELLLCPLLARLSHRTRGTHPCCLYHRGLLHLGIFGMISGQLFLAFIPGFLMSSMEEYDETNRRHFALSMVLLGCLITSVARASALVGVYARVTQFTPTYSQLCFVIGIATYFLQVGEALGYGATKLGWFGFDYFAIFASPACLATSACFKFRLSLLANCVLMPFGLLLSAIPQPSMPERGHQRKRCGERRAQRRSRDANSDNIEVFFVDPGARCVIVISMLGWLAIWTIDSSVDAFVIEDVLQTAADLEALGQAHFRKACLGAVFSLLPMPYLMLTLSWFGTWLCGSILLASLLLLAPIVSAIPSAAIVITWISSFGPLRAVQIAIPYAVLVKRARARGVSDIVPVAAVSVVPAASRLFWAVIAPRLSDLLALRARLICVGAAFAIWAAALCARAIASDCDDLLSPTGHPSVDGESAPSRGSKKHTARSKNSAVDVQGNRM